MIIIVEVERRSIVPQCGHLFALELTFLPQVRQEICFINSFIFQAFYRAISAIQFRSQTI